MSKKLHHTWETKDGAYRYGGENEMIIYVKTWPTGHVDIDGCFDSLEQFERVVADIRTLVADDPAGLRSG